MKWIIALLVSALMFMTGYFHASRYIEDEEEEPDKTKTPSEDTAPDTDTDTDTDTEMTSPANPVAQI